MNQTNPTDCLQNQLKNIKPYIALLLSKNPKSTKNEKNPAIPWNKVSVSKRFKTPLGDYGPPEEWVVQTTKRLSPPCPNLSY